MIRNENRVGRFTSSEIGALMKRKAGTFDKPALTYIEEVKMERRLCRSLTDESNARPLTWGKLLERRAFNLLGLEYSLNSQDTLLHADFPGLWAGSPDGFKYDDGLTVTDIKSPFTLKSFCQLVQPIYDGLTGMDAMNAIREGHKDGEKFYWQLVSNSCVKPAKYAELIVYMPYESELEGIKAMADDGQGKHYWISMAGPDDLPYILDNGYYRNLNTIRFEVPQADKDALTEAVQRAGEKLPSILLAHHDNQLQSTIIEPA